MCVAQSVMLCTMFSMANAATTAVVVDEEESTTLSVGDTLQWEGVQYEVLTLDGTTGTVALDGAYIMVSELVIPGTFTYKGYSLMVTAIQSVNSSTMDEGQQTITSLTIPGTVATIEDYAFTGSKALTSLTILDSDTALVLPQYCFSENYALSGTLTIPSRVTKIGEMCFYGCYSISEVVLNEGLDSIGAGAFNNVTLPKTITIPATVTNIGLGAFTYWDNLKEIYCYAEDVPTTDSSSSDDASIFNYYSGDIYSTAHLHVPTGTADDYAAADYWKFETIIEGYDEPDGDTLAVEDEITIDNLTYVVMSLDADASTGSLMVTTNKPTGDVVIPGTVSYTDDVTTYTLTIDTIKNRAFYGATAMTAVTIPNTIRGIGLYAFMGCSKLTSVTFEEGGSYGLPNNCFNNCTSLESITLPSWLETIPNSCFRGDTKLSTVVFNEGLTYISQYAFYGCTALAEVSLPGTVTSVNGFNKCTGLTSLILGEGVEVIEKGAFDGCTGLTSVEFPSTVTSICGFQECTGLTSVVIPDATTSIEDYAFYGCTSLADVQLGSGLQTIGSYAFGKTAITSIELPDSLPAIGEYAFYSSNLESINIPDSVTSIGFAAFAGCSSLKRVYLPTNLEEIGYMTFSDCDALTDVYSYTAEPVELISTTLDDSSQDFIFSETALATATLHVPTGCKENYLNSEYYDYWAFDSIAEFSDTLVADLVYASTDPKAYVSFNELDADDGHTSLTQVTVTYDEGIFLSGIDTLKVTASHVTGDVVFDVTAEISADDPNSLVLSFDDLSVYEGSWYITIPEAFVVDTLAYETGMKQGRCNPATELWYYVETETSSEDELAITSQDEVTITVTPAEGTVTSLSTITLTFPDYDYAERILTTVYLYAADTVRTTGTVQSNAATGGNTFTINLAETVSGEGTYTLNVPAGTLSLWADPDDHPISCDLNFTWTIQATTGISNIATTANERYEVYTVSGMRILSTADRSELGNLPTGLYIINGKKHVVK